MNAGAQIAQGVGVQAKVGNHPNADQGVTFNGHAALAPGAITSPWAYHPVKLEKDFVQIKISHCGICGSDLHTITGGWGGCTYPQIVGHEIVGVIEEVGPEVKTLKKGDRVGVGAQCWSCRLPSCDACPKGHENSCPKFCGTYDSIYPLEPFKGQQTQGGYADRVRVCQDFAFNLPDRLESEVAGPLLCAGVTVYAPLKRVGVKQGVKVGVVGIGGLGHLGIQFASALGGEVTAISTSDSKKADAQKLGAHHFLNSKDPTQVADAARRFDVILCTANGNDNLYREWMSMLALRGKFIMVGMPDGLTVPISIGTMGDVEGEFVSSMIGPPHVIREMLEFAAEKGVKPWIEKLPMADVNKGLEKIRTNNVRYRVVLCNE